jgi:sialic acid synthase SpsE
VPKLELGRPVGTDHPPFIIATLDCRELPSLAAAFVAIDQAAKSECDAIRFVALPAAWEPKLFDRADLRGLRVVATPADERALQRFDWLGSDAFYFALHEVIDLQLIASAAHTGKPIVLATRDAKHAQIDQAIATARDNGSGGIALLGHELDALEVLGAHRKVIGIAETSQGTTDPQDAVTRGARIVEQRVGPELSAVVQDCAHAWAALDHRRWTTN